MSDRRSRRPRQQAIRCQAARGMGEGAGMGSDSIVGMRWRDCSRASSARSDEIRGQKRDRQPAQHAHTDSQASAGLSISSRGVAKAVHAPGVAVLRRFCGESM